MFGTDNSAPSLLFGEFSLYFPSLQGETGSRRTASIATQSRAFRLAVEARWTRSKNPKTVPQIGGAYPHRDQRDTTSRGQMGAYGLFSLLGNFRGHSLECKGAAPHRDIRF